MADILIMEPDRRAGQTMEALLSDAGHRCVVCQDVAEGMDFIRRDERILTILNARLPWTDSVSLLRALEEKNWPVLFITEDADNVAHLHAMYQAGCEVLISPFDGERLAEAVAGLLEASARLLTIGPLTLDMQHHTATMAGETLTLTAQEFSLLHVLMLSPDAALTREELLRSAWGYQAAGETRTVDVHIQRLRRKLGATCIETVYKLGYRLRIA